MSISIAETEKKCDKNELTKVVCPLCGERLRGVGLDKNSKIKGLLFRCRRCGAYLEVKSE